MAAFYTASTVQRRAANPTFYSAKSDEWACATITNVFEKIEGNYFQPILCSLFYQMSQIANLKIFADSTEAFSQLPETGSYSAGVSTKEFFLTRCCCCCCCRRRRRRRLLDQLVFYRTN